MGDGIMLHRVMQSIPRFAFVPTDPNAAPGYTFINDGHGNWRIKLLASGTFRFDSFPGSNPKIDIFLVGGGGGGAKAMYAQWSRTGHGGSGYTKTYTNISVTKNTNYSVTIGAGGTSGYKTNGGAVGGLGGDTTMAIGGTTYRAYGGNKKKDGTTHADLYRAHAYQTSEGEFSQGGNGGSGGGMSANANGGVDGANASGAASNHGYGQGSTTREFGEPTGDLYAQGGGASTPNTPNSGNGAKIGNSGSTGIVVIRNHRE